MRKNKILAIALISSLIAICASGSLAYFMDTEEKNNTFTMGNVDLKLTEPAWDETNNNLIPGISLPKDPTITLEATSNDAYMFLKLSVNKYISLSRLMNIDAHAAGVVVESTTDIEFVNLMLDNQGVREEVLERWFTGINYDDWDIMNGDEIKASMLDDTGEAEIILGYNTVFKADDSATYMTAFGIPATVTQKMVEDSGFNTVNENFDMSFTAYAIQEAGIQSLETAYNEMFSKQQ